ncbi:MAG: type II toxin-antitoxin system VapC family toxin [Hyphomonadaceae bacterium]|nr:type II toxin-antitoxin system VapC family toxin [Hyphomonadaceae bacterium]
MVIDASAIVAILEGEPDEDRFKQAIGAAQVRIMAPINLLEARIVAARRGVVGVQRLDELIAKSLIDVVPTDAAQLAAARMAFDRYGKGRHPAGLNIADCFAYALARTSGEALLFKGRDFALTDVLVA